MSSAPDPLPSTTAPWSNSMADDTGPAPLKPGAPKKGMALGKKKPGDIFAGMGITEVAPAAEEAAAPVEEAAPSPVVNPLADPVRVEIEEQIKAKMELDGGLSG